VVLLVYVDNINMDSPNSDLIRQTQQMLEATFKLKELGDLKYFLGLQIAKSKQGIHLCQQKYNMKLLTHIILHSQT